MTDTSQLLLQNANREANPARLLGSRGRQASLHAARRPAREIPRSPITGRDSRPLPPPRRLADPTPPAPLQRHRLQLQSRLHARHGIQG